MRIKGSQPTDANRPTQRAGASSAADGAAFARMLGESGGPAETAATGSTSNLGRINGLAGWLGLGDQAGTDDRPPQDQDRDHADRMLDRLERIRLSLLSGSLETGTLEALAADLARRRAAPQDPALSAIMDQVELLAAVELAKRGVFLDQD